MLWGGVRLPLATLFIGAMRTLTLDGVDGGATLDRVDKARVS